MGLFDLFRARPKNTAALATERLRIIVLQERAASGRPDYLPMLRRELLEVIRKYVNVDPDAIDIHVTREGEGEVLELSVALPEKPSAPPAAVASDEA
ncbi:cell division topological specificity factor MinE [Dokdonella sp.]|uniref:cell division topological specificity factor MinE n=1 Tax=Dokdonella sp. TaxID=2291710 RepID=UPI0025C5C1E7|nr:cell division topological specificity factor MinE [Dokdonella sp.]MBX3688488.1 cell division topological specificity factor MinE [Dokdonella sp.]